MLVLLVILGRPTRLSFEMNATTEMERGGTARTTIIMILPCCHVSGYVTHYFGKDSDGLGLGAGVLGGDKGVEVSSLDTRTSALEVLAEMIGAGGGYWICGPRNCVYKTTVGVRFQEYLCVICIGNGQSRANHD